MKCILLTSTLAAFLVSTVYGELNDMYLHHHPSQAKKLAMAAMAANENNQGYGAQDAGGNSYHYGGYDFRRSYDDSYGRNLYDSYGRNLYDNSDDGPLQRQPQRDLYPDYQPRRSDYRNEQRGPVVGGGYGNRMAAAGAGDGITYNKNGGIDWNSPTLKGSIFVDRGYDDASFDVSQNLKMASVVDPGENWHTGKGTYYDVETRQSSCGVKATNKDLVAALNSKQFGGKSKDNKNCGKEIEVTGPSGKTVRVKLIDGCDTCAEGDVDLSPGAFEAIGSFSHGSISIKWKEA